MKLKKSISKKFRRGSILGAVIVIGLCLALLGIGMLQMGFGSRVNSDISVNIITAREAADAGISKALYSMNAAFPNTDWEPTGSGTLPNSDVDYSYEITVPPYAIPRAGYYDHYQIKSTGTSSRGQIILYAITSVRNRFDYGLIVTDKITLNSGTLVDGYNTIRGMYTEPPDTTNSNGYIRIGTTSIDSRSILLQDTVVTGDILAGINGDVYDVIQNPGGKAITGSRYNLPEPWAFDPIVIPEAAYIPSGSIGNSTLWDGNGRYRIPEVVTGETTYLQFDSIDVPTGRELIFLGPVVIIVNQKLELNNSSILYVGEPDLSMPVVPSSVTIYLNGGLEVKAGGNINNLSRIPLDFQLFGTSDSYERWDIKNEGDYYGIYYGPNADITTFAKARFYGSVSGHVFTLFNGGRLHYDQALSGMTEYDSGFYINSWWEE